MRVNVSLPDEVLARVDAVRGDVSRSRWILRAVERVLAEGSFTPPSVESDRYPHKSADVRAAQPTTQPAPAPSRPSAAMERQARLNKAKGL